MPIPPSVRGSSRSTTPPKEPVSIPESLASIALWLNSNGYIVDIWRGTPRFRPLRRAAPSTTTVWRLIWWSPTPSSWAERGRLWVEVGEGHETRSISELVNESAGEITLAEDHTPDQVK